MRKVAVFEPFGGRIQTADDYLFFMKKVDYDDKA